MKNLSYRKILKSFIIVSSLIHILDSSSVQARVPVQVQRVSLPGVNIPRKDANESIVPTREMKSRSGRVAVSPPKRSLRSASPSPTPGRPQTTTATRSQVRPQPITRRRPQTTTVTRSQVRPQPITRGRPQTTTVTRLQVRPQPITRGRPQATTATRSRTPAQTPTRGRPQAATITRSQVRAQTPPPRPVTVAPVRTRAQTPPPIPPRPAAAVLARIRAQNPSLLPPRPVTAAPIRTRAQTQPTASPRPVTVAPTSVRVQTPPTALPRPVTVAPTSIRVQTPPTPVTIAPTSVRAQTQPTTSPRPVTVAPSSVRAQTPPLIPQRPAATAPIRTRTQAPQSIPSKPPGKSATSLLSRLLNPVAAPAPAPIPAPALAPAPIPAPVPVPLYVSPCEKRLKEVSGRISFTPKELAVASWLNALCTARNPFTLSEFNAGQKLYDLGNRHFSRDEVHAVQRFTTLGKANFTLAEMNAGTRLFILGKTQFTINELNTALRLCVLENIHFSLEELQAAQHLMTLGKLSFTSDELAAGTRLLAIDKPQFTETELRAASRLRGISSIYFSSDELQAALQLMALGKVYFTDDDLTIARHLVSHFEKSQFTEREFLACQRLRTLYLQYYSQEYLNATEQLMALGRVNISEQEINMARRIISTGIAHITVANFDAANSLQERGMYINTANLNAATRLIQNNHRAFRDEDITATHRLIILGRVMISRSMLTAAKRLIDIGNSAFTNPELEAAGELIRLEYPNFRQPMLNAALRLRSIGRPNFSEDHLLLAQRLMDRGHRQFTDADFATALAPPARPARPAPARPAPARPAPVPPGGVAAPAPAPAPAPVPEPEPEVEAAPPLPPPPVRDWGPLTPVQRLDDFLQIIMSDNVLLQNTGFSVGSNINRLAWKDLVIELMTPSAPDRPSEVPMLNLPAVRPPTLRLLVAQSTMALNKALTILRFEQTSFDGQRLSSRQEVKEFLAFQVELDNQARSFMASLPYTFTVNQKFKLFKKLKAQCLNAFGNQAEFPKYKAALFTILSHSLPLDHPSWPANEDGNCDDFIGHVVVPALTTAAQDNVVAIEGLPGTGLVYALQRTFPEAITPTIERIVRERLEANDRDYKAKITRNLGEHATTLEVKQMNQLDLHGAKYPANNGGIPGAQTFNAVTTEIRNWLRDEETRCRSNRTLRTHINYQHLCRDPSLAILIVPDERLQQIMRTFSTTQQEVDALKALVDLQLPASLRGDDAAFNNSFSNAHYGLSENDEATTRLTVGRVKRLYETVMSSAGEAEAAKVIYYYGISNDGRCIDGKRDGLLDLERKYVYVARGNDRDTIVAATCAKLFMDDRMDAVRMASDNIYPAGENRTYCAFNTSRAISVGYGLPVTYEATRFPFTAHITGKEFVEKYFKGGRLLGQDIRIPARHQGNRWIPSRIQTLTHNFKPLTEARMIALLRDEVGKAMGGSFDDKTLDHMINSDLAMRKAYAEFMSNAPDPTDAEQMRVAANFQNAYFKDATKTLRKALKDEAYRKVLNRYNYVSTRADERSPWN